MTPQELLRALREAESVAAVEEALEAFEQRHGRSVRWLPVGGREANRGIIEVSADPGRALIERITNGIDAVLEAEHERHRGVPACRTPKEAARAWLNVPEPGLSEMTPVQRRGLAQLVTVRLLPGEDRNRRVVEIIDRGTGLAPEEMPRTILSLNESNKLQKHYLAGTYGQGGSASFAASKYTLIASRRIDHRAAGFTVVRFLDLPPEQFKTGHYVYLTLDGRVLEVELPPSELDGGTLVRHYGYDLTPYPSPVGPNSLYGLLNAVLFDPVMPVWFDNRVHNYRRVIKGSRNALNGAVDEGDEQRRGPTLSHHVRLFYVTLADSGSIGIEYWLLESPTPTNRRPTAAFVNPARPIILTINGQNHAELSVSLIRREAELPYLTQRLIVHVNCDPLTPAAKRALFASTREEARRGLVYELIQDELVRALKSDDDLARLNNEAREQRLQERDEAALQQMRREVANLLRLHGVEVTDAEGGKVHATADSSVRPTHPRGARRLSPIELHEPPTFIRIVGDPDEEITFYAQQRRYIRIETDANSSYHNPLDPTASRINVIIAGQGLLRRGTTPLHGGRMRVIIDGAADAAPGTSGSIRVELSRPGLPSLADERGFRIVEAPPARPTSRRLSLPPFDPRPVDGPDDPQWNALGWPENVNLVASSAFMEGNTLVIPYSTAFPPYATRRAAFERRDPDAAASFTRRYEIWLVVHSLLLHQHLQEASPSTDLRPDLTEVYERQERCRVATLSALFASREVQMPVAAETVE